MVSDQGLIDDATRASNLQGLTRSPPESEALRPPHVSQLPRPKSHPKKTRGVPHQEPQTGESSTLNLQRSTLQGQGVLDLNTSPQTLKRKV